MSDAATPSPKRRGKKSKKKDRGGGPRWKKLSATVSPVAAESKTKGTQVKVVIPVDDRRRAAFEHGKTLAGDLLEKKATKERAAKDMSEREQKTAIGSWMFGDGGIRGLSIASEKKRKEDAKVRKVDTGETGTATGFAVNMQSRTKTERRGMLGGQDKLDVALSKYERKTKAYRERREAKLGKGNIVSKLGPRKPMVVKSKKQRLKEAFGKCFKSIGACVSTMWNGPPVDEDKEIENQPIILGGIYRRVAETVGLTQVHLRKLRAVFREIDFSGMGNISLDEVMEHIDEKPSAYVERLYRQLIETQIGRTEDKVMNYDNFVMFVVVFGLLSKPELLQFIFDTFDADSSGMLDEEEVCVLLNVINHERPMYPGNFNKMLTEFDADGDGYLSLEEFDTLNRKYPAVLFPAFRLQDSLIRNTLGIAEFLKLESASVVMKQQRHAKKQREKK